MNLPFKISEREKKYLVYGGTIVVLILGFHLFTGYSGLRKEVREIADTRLFVLEKQLVRIAAKDEMQAGLVTIREDLEKQEKSFLLSNKPPVAAAALQRFLKDRASSLGIDVKLERTLSPINADFYLGIPVEIGFAASTKKFRDLLVELRKSRFLLTVTEIKVRVTNISNPTDIYTTLVVTGFIKKPEAKDKKGKGPGNVS